MQKARIKRNKKAKRTSGGIIIFYKTELKYFINIHDNTDENIFWIKINGNKIENQQDLLYCKKNSSYNIKTMTYLQNYKIK